MPSALKFGLLFALAVVSTWARAATAAAPDYAATAARLRHIAAGSPRVRALDIGKSAEGRTLVAAVAGATDAQTPAAARAAHRGVVFVLSGLGVGDLAGKDAVIEWLQSVASAATAPAWTDHLVVVAVPALNADGLARLADAGTVGVPAALAEPFQGTPALIDLAHGFLYARSPAVRAWLRLVREWRPEAYVVLRTNLRQPPSRSRLAWSVLPGAALAHPVAAWQTRFAGGLADAFAQVGLAAVPCYRAREPADPEAGLTGCAPRAGSPQELAMLTNRPALSLILPRDQAYPSEVDAGSGALAAALDRFAARAAALADAVAAADRAPLDGASAFALRFDFPDGGSRRRFEGYAYTTMLSPISGSVWAHYRTAESKTYFLPWTEDAQVAQRLAPWPAYALAPAWTRVIHLLALHGIVMRRLPAPAALELHNFLATRAGAKTVFAPAPVTGTAMLPAGSVLIPGDQPAAKLAAALLLPDSPDSLLHGGYFDAVFAAAVPIPDAALEERARAALAADPALARSFARRLARDPGFAASPARRLEFFVRHRAVAPPLLDVYPVYQLPGGIPKASQ